MIIASTLVPPSSVTRSLLENPEINHSGVEASVVFAALVDMERRHIAGATSESAKLDLACQFGDQSPVVARIHDMFCVVPAQRLASGVAFPTIDRIEDSIFFRLLTILQQDAVREIPDENSKRAAVKALLEI